MSNQSQNTEYQSQPFLPRDFKGIWIPKEIWLDKRLNYFEKCLLAEIHSLNGEKGCYASNVYFCNFFGERERKIQDGLAKLKNFGYIFVESFDGRTRTLRTNLFPDKTLFNTPDLSKNDTSNLSISCNVSQGKNDEHTLYKKKENNIVVVVSDEKLECKKIEKKFSKDDLYRNCIRLKKDWTDEEMEKALKIYENSSYPISDPLSYVEGIIKKNRQVKIIQKEKEKECPSKQEYTHKKKLSQKEDKTKETLEKNKSQNTNSEVLDKDIGMRLFANWKETL